MPRGTTARSTAGSWESDVQRAVRDGYSAPLEQRCDLGGGEGAAFVDVAVAVGDVIGASASGDIGLKRVACGVVPVADEFDGDALLRPVAVDLVAVLVDVRARERKVVAQEEGEKVGFEVAERDIAAVGLAEFLAPRLCGLRAMQASMWSGLTSRCTQASWQARARSGGVRRGARSSRTRGPIVARMPYQVVVSSWCIGATRWMTMPGRLRCDEVGTVTSGSDGRPRRIPRRWPAEWRLATAPSPQASTAAMRSARHDGAVWPTAYRPWWTRRSRPSASQRRIRLRSTPFAASCSWVTRPC